MTDFPKKSYALVVCKDGFSMSIQASRGHYCEPRDDVGPYTSVEVGCPNKVEPLLLECGAEDPSRPTETVYGWVPSLVIYEVIKKHGGAVSGEVPPMVIV